MIGKYCWRLFCTANLRSFLIKDILQKKSSKTDAAIQGWVRSIRKHKRAVFVDVNDGSTLLNLQLVINPEKLPSDISYGSSIKATGDIVMTKLHKGGVEFVCNNMTLLGHCDESYPFVKHANHDVQYFRSFPHLRMKDDLMASVLRTRNALEMEIHKYFQEKGFLHIHTPLLTSSDCEGAGALFSVNAQACENSVEDDQCAEYCASQSSDFVNQLPSSTAAVKAASESSHFFGKPVYLTVSGQLHLEACAQGVGNVYTLSPAFRAEHCISRKHLSEFRMLEVESTYTQDLEQLMDLIEDSVKSFLKSTAEKCCHEQNYFLKNLPKDYYACVQRATQNNYERLPYSDVLDILQKHSSKLDSAAPSWGDDFNSEQEKFLVKHCGDIPVFITDFPSSSKPFYTFENSNGQTVSAVDLIFPYVGELCGGSVREHRFDVLSGKLRTQGMEESYNWYLDLRRYGGTPHAGYGMGFDRLVRFLLGIHNIRDAVPFPRSTRSCIL